MWYLLLFGVIIVAYFIFKGSGKKIGSQFPSIVHSEQEPSKETKQKRVVSKSWGEFEVTGTYYLEDSVKSLVKGISKGDFLILNIDYANDHDDHAIKVFYEGVQVGWVDREYHKKKVLFKALQEGKETRPVVTSCYEKKKGGSYFIKAKYEFEKG